MKIALPFSVSLGLLGIMTMMSLGLWQALPAGTQLALHLGLGGEGGSTAPAPVILAILPVLAVAATLVFALLPRLMPGLERIQGRYIATWLLIALVLAVGQGIVIRHALFTLQALKAAQAG